MFLKSVLKHASVFNVLGYRYYVDLEAQTTQTRRRMNCLCWKPWHKTCISAEPPSEELCRVIKHWLGWRRATGIRGHLSHCEGGTPGRNNRVVPEVLSQPSGVSLKTLSHYKTHEKKHNTTMGLTSCHLYLGQAYRRLGIRWLWVGWRVKKWLNIMGTSYQSWLSLIKHWPRGWFSHQHLTIWIEESHVIVVHTSWTPTSEPRQANLDKRMSDKILILLTIVQSTNWKPEQN